MAQKHLRRTAETIRGPALGYLTLHMPGSLVKQWARCSPQGWLIVCQPDKRASVFPSKSVDYLGLRTCNKSETWMHFKPHFCSLSVGNHSGINLFPKGHGAAERVGTAVTHVCLICLGWVKGFLFDRSYFPTARTSWRSACANTAGKSLKKTLKSPTSNTCDGISKNCPTVGHRLEHDWAPWIFDGYDSL